MSQWEIAQLVRSDVTEYIYYMEELGTIPYSTSSGIQVAYFSYATLVQ